MKAYSDMKLAFNGQAHYPDFDEAYSLYTNRSKMGLSVDEKTYRKIIKRYCGLLSDRLEKDGAVDLPRKMGTIAAAVITRRPQYRGKQFVGYGKKDWTTGRYDGKLKTFGLVYLPRRNRHKNLRSFGFVSNRQLFKRMKNIYETEHRWEPLDFNGEMI